MRKIITLVLLILFCDAGFAQCESLDPQAGSTCRGSYILSSADISNPTQQCGDVSSALGSTLDCMASHLPPRARVLSSVSDSNSNWGSDCVPGSFRSSMCVHSENSCHYGGRDCPGQSYAVDFKNTECREQIRAALEACAPDAYFLPEGSHIHISVGASAGCNCDTAPRPPTSTTPGPTYTIPSGAPGREMLHSCYCSGECHGVSLVEQAVKRIPYDFNLLGSESEDMGAECCEICEEIWGQECGGYANCRITETITCENCCNDWCTPLIGHVVVQCMAACTHNCEAYMKNKEILDLISSIAVVIAAILFAIHAIAILMSFGPYERSRAKEGIKYVIIALIFLGIAINFVEIIFYPFRAPTPATGAIEPPTCGLCNEVEQCSDYTTSAECLSDLCAVSGGAECYLASGGSCSDCGSSTPSSCGDYDILGCTLNPCGIPGGCVTSGDSCIASS